MVSSPAAAALAAPTTTWWQRTRRRWSRIGVGLLWLLGAAMSYSALRDLALMLGVRDPLAYAFPLVIDVAVWVGSMNALEARDQGRQGVEKYAWFLVALYALATIVGNVIVGATESLDPRLVHALGEAGARWAAEIAGPAPAVTMILFSHLAGLLMEGKPKQPMVPLAEAKALREQLAEATTQARELREQLMTAPAIAGVTADDPAPVAPTVIERTDDSAGAAVEELAPVTAVMTGAEAGGDRVVAVPPATNGHRPTPATTDVAAIQWPANGHDRGHVVAPAPAAPESAPDSGGDQEHDHSPVIEGSLGGHVRPAAEGPPAADPAPGRADVPQHGHDHVAEAATVRPSGDGAGGHPEGLTAASPDGRAETGGLVASDLSAGPPAGHDRDREPVADRPSDDDRDDRDPLAEMTAEEAKAAVARLVRQARRAGRPVTAADVQRVTGRKARQARRLLAQAVAAVSDDTPASRPRVLTSQAVGAGARKGGVADGEADGG
jgi:uncharacterized protein DUF2637